MLTDPGPFFAQMGHFWLYFVLVFGIIVIPGMDMAYVMASALTGGRKAGAAAVAGTVLGGVGHLLMGILGIGVLIHTFPAAANVMLLFGCAYLAWIGWSLCNGATALGEVHRAEPQALSRVFVQALLTCLLNPKAYLFTLAVFPQFLRADQGSILLQGVVLGSITAATQIAVYGAVALGAAKLRQWLRSNRAAQVRLGQSIGLILIAASIWTAWRSWA
jgi:threonine/homoserine/homoserine lactone efflux protein